MTRRSRSIDVHGLPKTNIDGLYSLPEKPEDVGPPSIHFSYIGNDPLSLQSRCRLDTSKIPATGKYINDIFSEASSADTGENTIRGQSNPYSWGNDDEYDRKATVEVQKMFAEIDHCLFKEGYNSEETEIECSDWTQSFPYIRLLGKQLKASDEIGTQILRRQPNQDETVSNSNIFQDLKDESSGDNVNLTVIGQKIDPIVWTNATEFDSDESHLNEEVFAIDGEIEEFIAYDSNSGDNRDRKRTPDSLQMKFAIIPPSTPDAFVHDTLINECLDQIWLEIVHILNQLLKLFINARAKREVEREHSILYSNLDGFLDHVIEFPQSRDDFSRLTRLPSQLKSRDSSNLKDLKELMTIRSVSLKHRLPSATVNNITRISSDECLSQKDPNNYSVLSVIGSSRQLPKPLSNRNNENIDRMLSAKVSKRNSRLLPLQTPITAGSHEAEIVGDVIGTRLQTSDRVSPFGAVSHSQQLWGAPHIGMLPPLEHLETSDTTIISMKDKRGISPKRHSRESSAVSTDSKSYPMRERLKIPHHLPEYRPSTTQSHRDFSTNKTIITQGKLKDHLHSISKPSFHQTLKERTYGYESQDFDDFILWGYGPPLISPQRKKGKPLGSNYR